MSPQRFDNTFSINTLLQTSSENENRSKTAATVVFEQNENKTSIQPLYTDLTFEKDCTSGINFAGENLFLNRQQQQQKRLEKQQFLNPMLFQSQFPWLQHYKRSSSLSNTANNESGSSTEMNEEKLMSHDLSMESEANMSLVADDQRSTSTSMSSDDVDDDDDDESDDRSGPTMLPDQRNSFVRDEKLKNNSDIAAAVLEQQQKFSNKSLTTTTIIQQLQRAAIASSAANSASASASQANQKDWNERILSWLYASPSVSSSSPADVLKLILQSRTFMPFAQPSINVHPHQHHHLPSHFSYHNHNQLCQQIAAVSSGVCHKRKGGQIRFTNEQTDTLENTFDTHKYLSNPERKTLAKSLSLTERQDGEEEEEDRHIYMGHHLFSNNVIANASPFIHSQGTNIVTTEDSIKNAETKNNDLNITNPTRNIVPSLEVSDRSATGLVAMEATSSASYFWFKLQQDKLHLRE